MTDVEQSLPHGRETLLGKQANDDGSDLSGGELQRIALARMYMSRRKIYILDEPAAALDPIAEMTQFKNIKNKLNDCTAVLISHRIGFARLADRIFVLKDGNIVETGTHEELIQNGGYYKELFERQAEWYRHS